MHFIHLVAVEADDAQEAISEAETGIAPYGDGDVWDWHQVGGRWDGELEGENTLCYASNAEAFEKHLTRCKESRWESIQEILNHLTGRQIGSEDVVDRYGTGFKGSLEDVADRMNETHAKEASEFQKVLALKELPEDRITRSLVGYRLYKLGKLISDFYCDDSYFYDAVYGSPSFGDIHDRCSKDPNQQWLVAIDMHN